jgi:nuclease-like protein
LLLLLLFSACLPVIVLVFRVFVFWCFRVVQTQDAMHACSPQPMRFALLGLALAATPLGCAARQQEPPRQDDCIVAHVADGDSFRCADGRQVRLIGVDSPESQQRPYGERARNALLELLRPAAAVRLESDVVPTDRYGRRLAYVWVGPTLVNEAMVLGRALHRTTQRQVCGAAHPGAKRGPRTGRGPLVPAWLRMPSQRLSPETVRQFTVIVFIIP